MIANRVMLLSTLSCLNINDDINNDDNYDDDDCDNVNAINDVNDVDNINNVIDRKGGPFCLFYILISWDFFCKIKYSQNYEFTRGV